MNKTLIKQYREKYYDYLMLDCIPFWLKHGMDHQNGGMYTCLDRAGNVYNTDKSVWLNGRAAWLFAYLCDIYGEKPEWKAASLNCLKFLNDHAIDPADQRMYFTLTEEGLPLRKRRYFFSETFYIMACAQVGKSFNDKKALETARWYYDFLLKIFLDRANDPFKITPKVNSDTRAMRGFAEPMILLNVSHVMRHCDPKNREHYDITAKMLTDTIFELFYKPEFGVFLEATGPHGEFMKHVTGGRTINPGHTIEAVWFILNQAQHAEDNTLKAKAASIFDAAIEIGWDKQYGGILAFTDALGAPPEQLEHDMKLWWPVTETLISTIQLFEETKNEKYWDWFVKTDEYGFNHFADPENGEWYGYLRRDGAPTEPPCKGNLFKGAFHLPRALILVEQCLARMESKE